MSAPTTRSSDSPGNRLAAQHTSCDAPNKPSLQPSQLRQFPAHASSQAMPPRKVPGNWRAHAPGCWQEAAVLMTDSCLCWPNTESSSQQILAFTLH